VNPISNRNPCHLDRRRQSRLAVAAFGEPAAARAASSARRRDPHDPIREDGEEPRGDG
jgi:hypothetical protein